MVFAKIWRDIAAVLAITKFKFKYKDNCSRALLQYCYNFFTLGLDLLTGKNGGDIINLNSGG